MRFLRFSFLLIALLAGAARARAAEMPTGLWDTQDKTAQVELFDCGGAICGRTRWIQPPDDRDTDANNPDPAKRSRPICGLQVLTGFKPNGDGTYSDGRVYDPHNGSVYHAQMKVLASGQLELRGYILTPVLGASEIWTRGAPKPSCAGQTP